VTEVGGGGGPPRFPSGPKEPLKARPKAAADKAKGAAGKGKATATPGGESKGDAGLSQDSFSRSVGGAAGVRPAVPPQSHALVRLRAGGVVESHGELRAGGRLTVEWDPQRAPAAVLGGPPGSWGAELGVLFTPRGNPALFPCAELVVLRGVPMGMPKGAAVTVDVPLDAQGVELWVRVWQRAGGTSQDHADIPRDQALIYPVKPRLVLPAPQG